MSLVARIEDIAMAMNSTRTLSTKTATLEMDGVDEDLDKEVDAIIEIRLPGRKNYMQDRHADESFGVRNVKQLAFHRRFENMVLFKTGYSQAYISERSGIPQSQLSRYFSGRSKPTMDNLMRILRVIILRFDSPDTYMKALYDLLNPFQMDKGEENNDDIHE